MAQKPDRKGAPPDGRPKKKSNKGIVAIIWVASLIVAFILGWVFGSAVVAKVSEVAGLGAETAQKAQILSKLDGATLEKARKDATRKTIEDAYAKQKDKASKIRVATGEFEFKKANADNNVTKKEWKDITEAFGG